MVLEDFRAQRQRMEAESKDVPNPSRRVDSQFHDSSPSRAITDLGLKV